jgi:hypothetical protein
MTPDIEQLLLDTDPVLGVGWDEWNGITRFALADWLEENGLAASSELVRHGEPYPDRVTVRGPFALEQLRIQSPLDCQLKCSLDSHVLFAINALAGSAVSYSGDMAFGSSIIIPHDREITLCVESNQDMRVKRPCLVTLRFAELFFDGMPTGFVGVRVYSLLPPLVAQTTFRWAVLFDDKNLLDLWSLR